MQRCAGVGLSADCVCFVSRQAGEPISWESRFAQARQLNALRTTG